jgi:hypothetical protein
LNNQHVDMRLPSWQSDTDQAVQAMRRRAFIQVITKYRVIQGSGCFRELWQAAGKQGFFKFPQDKLPHPVSASRCKSGRFPAVANNREPPDEASG